MEPHRALWSFCERSEPFEGSAQACLRLIHTHGRDLRVCNLLSVRTRLLRWKALARGSSMRRPCQVRGRFNGPSWGSPGPCPGARFGNMGVARRRIEPRRDATRAPPGCRKRGDGVAVPFSVSGSKAINPGGSGAKPLISLPFISLSIFCHLLNSNRSSRSRLVESSCFHSHSR